MSIEASHPRFKSLFVGATLFAVGCDSSLPATEKTPADPQGMTEPKATPTDCAPAALLSGQIVASARFVRSAGKPTTEFLPFTLGEDEDLCVLINTGTVSSTGEVVEPAPASMTVTLDGSLELARPNDFTAKPQALARAADSPPGDHTLAVELHGKGGLEPAVAVVTVLAVPSASVLSSMSPVTSDRFEDPKKYATVMKDEAVVIFAEFPTAPALASTLGLLPFPAVAVGRLAGVPTYQVYLPGATGGADLRARISAIGQLPGVVHAGLHHVGGVFPMLLPAAGTDVDYIDPDGELRDVAWHIRDIKANMAWTVANTTSPARMGVVDNGFRVDHPDLVGNISQWSIPTMNLDSSQSANAAFMAPREKPEICERDPEKCLIWSACFPPLNGDHGTAVAGLMAAEGENNFAGDDANAVGVVWHGDLHLGNYGYVTFTNPPPDTAVYSSFGAQRIVDTMAQDGARVVNMSFGFGVFCANGEVAPDFRTMDLDAVLAQVNERITDEAREWGELLTRHERLMLVNAAGNRGAFCSDKNLVNAPPQWPEIPAILCDARASGLGCAVQGDEAKQVLCVGSADKAGQIAASSSPTPDRLVAPGVDVGVLRYEGKLLVAGGTSVAAPIVAGAVSLLQGMNMEMNPRVLHDIITTGGPRPPVGDERYRNLDLLAASQQVARCRAKYTDFAAGAAGCPQFSDVHPGEWYYEGVHRLACNCVLQGYEDGTFAPSGEINRAEALKVVLLIAFPYETFPAPQVAPYVDVPANAWFAGYVAFAKSKGIIGGGFLAQGNALAPATPLTRGEFARLLVESAKLSDVEQLQKLAEAIDAPPPTPYTDVPANYPYRDHIYAATNQCIVEGQGGGTKFAPDATLNRAEASKAGCLAIYGFGGLQCGENPDTCTPALE